MLFMSDPHGSQVAVYYDTINTIPFFVIVKMALIWLFVAFPLAVVGCMFGRHWGGKASFPCRVNRCVTAGHHSCSVLEE
jgi:Endomembrane protein 70